MAVQQVALFPCLNINSGKMEYRTWAAQSSPDDPLLPSSYKWRMEDIAASRSPSLRRIAVTFRDLGQVTTTWTATSENAGVVQSVSIPVTWGNIVPTGRLMSKLVDLLITGQLIQISVSRAANAGPLAIVKVTLAIQVEEKSL